MLHGDIDDVQLSLLQCVRPQVAQLSQPGSLYQDEFARIDIIDAAAHICLRPCYRFRTMCKLRRRDSCRHKIRTVRFNCGPSAV